MLRPSFWTPQTRPTNEQEMVLVCIAPLFRDMFRGNFSITLSDVIIMQSYMSECLGSSASDVRIPHGLMSPDTETTVPFSGSHLLGSRSNIYAITSNSVFRKKDSWGHSRRSSGMLAPTGRANITDPYSINSCSLVGTITSSTIPRKFTVKLEGARPTFLDRDGVDGMLKDAGI
ncbi:hypothetical protein F4804DRAFT_327794, partial [Jackrogersella minutella]